MKNIDKYDVKNFFDNIASSWDADQVDRSDVIREILDIAMPLSGTNVLDVACGTGILFPYYFERGVNSVTGVDISSNMIDIARKNISKELYSENISLLCEDIEEANFSNKFNLAMVYNAYPHFSDGDKLIKILHSNLVDGGRLIIAHGFSREIINKHHSGSASSVSHGLEDAKVLANKFSEYFNVDAVVSDEEKYIVSGIKKSV